MSRSPGMVFDAPDAQEGLLRPWMGSIILVSVGVVTHIDDTSRRGSWSLHDGCGVRVDIQQSQVDEQDVADVGRQHGLLCRPT